MTSDDAIIARALEILASRLAQPGIALTDCTTAKNYLTLQLAAEPRELFVALWLTTQNTLIAYEVLSLGTLAQAQVYPREVVKSGLRHNAARVLLAHNHPSQNPTPSDADIRITRSLSEALALVDIHVLDHIIVGGTQTLSLAERGLI